jgi:hypothetical protein
MTREDWCRLTDVKGRLEYEGKFVSFPDKAPIATDELTIDPIKTREHKLWVGDALVPLVYLRNGKILVPAARYDDAAHLLERLR